MKTALISFITASLLVVASFASGRPVSAFDFVIILFTTGLVAWTVEQYSREVRPLTSERPLRFPVAPGVTKHRPTAALPVAA
jgi:hypothetical protein